MVLPCCEYILWLEVLWTVTLSSQSHKLPRGEFLQKEMSLLNHWSDTCYLGVKKSGLYDVIQCIAIFMCCQKSS